MSLADFAAKVRAGLDTLDWLGTRDIIRTLVRRIKIDGDHIEVVFRVPPPGSSAPPTPGSAGGNAPSLQDSVRAVVERTIAWLNRCRRLAKDWECLNRRALAFLRWASARRMLRRLCQKTI